MTHPSVFELDVFIRRGATSAEFEQHVSACDACASRLSSLARRASPAALVREDSQGRRLQTAAVALAACLAVLLVRTVSLPVESNVAPEGVHGVASQQVVMIVAESGPTDSGVR